LLTIEAIEEAHRQGTPVTFPDPVLVHAKFPLRRSFYPMGFPVEVATNCEEILDAVAESWSGFTQLFDTPPIHLQIGVLTGKSSECPPTPMCRVQQNIVSNIADADNFSVCDLDRGFSSIWLTRAVLAHRDYLRYFFLDAAIFCQLATRHTTAIHAGCIARNGIGVMLCGDSGAGKSTLSYACAKAGWTFVTDDASFLVHGRNDRFIVGNCNRVRFRPSATEFFPELEGRDVTQRADIGKPSIELGTAPYHYLSRAFSATVKYVIFLNRRGAHQEGCVSYPKEVARTFMRQNLFSTTQMKTIQHHAIEQLLEAEVLELRYQNLEWAINQLTRLTDTV
jgi:hypothetical protein